MVQQRSSWTSIADSGSFLPACVFLYEIMLADVKLSTLLTLSRDVKDHRLQAFPFEYGNHAVCYVARANAEVDETLSRLLVAEVRGGGSKGFFFFLSLLLLSVI